MKSGVVTEEKKKFFEVQKKCLYSEKTRLRTIQADRY